MSCVASAPEILLRQAFVCSSVNGRAGIPLRLTDSTTDNTNPHCPQLPGKIMHQTMPCCNDAQVSQSNGVSEGHFVPRAILQLVRRNTCFWWIARWPSRPLEMGQMAFSSHDRERGRLLLLWWWYAGMVIIIMLHIEILGWCEKHRTTFTCFCLLNSFLSSEKLVSKRITTCPFVPLLVLCSLIESHLQLVSVHCGRCHGNFKLKGERQLRRWRQCLCRSFPAAGPTLIWFRSNQESVNISFE
jgi:hypothetical protein